MKAESSDSAVGSTGDRNVGDVRRTVQQYAVAFAATGSAALLNFALWPELGARYPLIAFFPAIAVSSWFGGFRPGALSTILSAAGASYLWFAPRFARASYQGDALVLTLFIVIGLITATLFETLKRRTERAEQAEREAIRLSKELRILDNRVVEAERLARQEAERLNRLKDDILSMVSHELRTPLGAILGWTDVLKKGLVDDTSRDRALEAIHRNAQVQVQLLGDLLDAARIKSGTLQLKYESVDLQALVRDAWENVAVAGDAKGLVGHIDVDSSPHSFYGDAARLQQIVSNLFSNAVKYTPHGGKVSAHIRRYDGVVARSSSPTMDGASLQSSCRWSLSRFGKLTTRQKATRQDSDWACRSSKHLVEAHGGEIHVASDGEDRGTTFTVRLPVGANLVNRQWHHELAASTKLKLLVDAVTQRTC